MSTQEVIDKLNEYAEYANAYTWDVPIDMPNVLYRAAATIEILREELKCLLERK